MKATEAKEHCNLVFASKRTKNLDTQNGTQIVVYIAVASWGDLQVDLALAHSFYVHMKLKSGFQNTNVLLLRTATLKLNCGHPELFKKPLNSVQLILFQLMNYHFREYQLIYIYKYYKYFKCVDIKWRGFKPLKPCF